MNLYRTTVECKKTNVFKVMGTTGFILTAVGLFVFLGITQSQKIVAGPIMLIGCAVLTVMLFSSFIFFCMGNSNDNNEKLTAFVITDDGKLVHLFYNDSDIEQHKVIPYGLLFNVTSIANSVSAIKQINDKADFVNSDTLLPYVEGVLNGTISYSGGKIRIAFVENPHIMQETKIGVCFYYTAGKHQIVNAATLYKSNEGYEKILSILHNTKTAIDYKGIKPGTYLVQ